MAIVKNPLVVDTNNDYVLGKGMLLVKKPGETLWRFMGNVPQFGISQTTDKLEHTSSTGGVARTDKSVITKLTRSGTLQTDSITGQNLSLLLMGTATTGTRAAITSGTKTLVVSNDDITNGSVFRLMDDNNKGLMFLDTVKVTNPGKVELEIGKDFVVNKRGALISFMASDLLLGGGSLTVSYTAQAATITRIAAGGVPTTLSIMFVSDNPAGNQVVWELPQVDISPSDSFDLIADEWQTMSFDCDIGEPATGEPAISGYMLEGGAVDYNTGSIKESSTVKTNR